MKINDEVKTETKLDDKSLNDLPGADEQAEKTQGGEFKGRIQLESWSWGVTNSGSHG